jgi:hypothetical protein
MRRVLLTDGHSIAIFACTPPEIAGIVGAMFNSAVQLASAVILAIITAIQVSIDGDTTADHGGQTGADRYKGRAAAFWFILGLMGVAGLAVLAFFRDKTTAGAAVANGSDAESRTGSGENERELIDTIVQDKDVLHTRA